VNFNCAAYIPYFPAGYHRGERGNAIVFGLETPDLLAPPAQVGKAACTPCRADADC
jgi:hypothetical protein